MVASQPNHLVSFWHGPLGWMEHLCIRSVVATGHRLAIYSYERRNPIAGVEWRDARAMIGTDDPIFPELKLSAQAFSDLFRYELLARGEGVWIDLDLYFLKPLGATSGHLYGWEKPDRVNSAILLLPSDSGALADLIRFVRKRPIYAPWWRPKHKIRQRIAIAIGRPLPLSSFPNGQFGPKALTHFLRQHDFLRVAAPQEVFYPIPPQNHAHLISSEVDVNAFVTKKTIAVHLWSNAVKRLLGGRMPPPGSYIGRLLRVASALDLSRMQADR